MKFVFVYISLLSISTLLDVKTKTPFALSNIQIIETYMWSFLGELELVRKTRIYKRNNRT